MQRPKPLVLLILDGFGERPERENNAVRLAQTPAMDALFAAHEHTLIGASGPDVGLPPGQMGNSEVGHLSFGAGRIAKMDMTRIDDAVADGSFATNPVLVQAIATAKAQGGAVHLLGLLSDGGVHSSIVHFMALAQVVEQAGVPLWIHAFTDGRDVAPGTAPGFVQTMETQLTRPNAKIATVAGRFFAMDRDNRWDRVELAYHAIVHAKGARFATAEAGLAASFEADKHDEFVEPFVVGEYAGVGPNDVGIHVNFRPDRARELTHALTQPGFPDFARAAGAPLPHFASLTSYGSDLANVPVAYPKQAFTHTLPEVLSAHGLTQFRCAETEKYAHVTYFFNGGREEPFPGEDRKLVPSIKSVATYDLAPAMSVAGVTDAVVEAIASDRYDFLLVNFANPDMVGHTGDLQATVSAIESVDAGVGRIAAAVAAKHGVFLLSADHGNCETMIDVHGNPHTAHTLNPVPFLCVQSAQKRPMRSGGRLADVAPTILELLGIEIPAEMTGESLFTRG